jgi:hypothetical protein
MPELPTYVYPFALAAIAFAAGRFLLGRAHDDPGSLPGWTLHALAIACVLVGLVTVWMDSGY